MKTRQEFIEADYVNGVYDSKGNELIRPMTKEEVEWLTQFYAETEHGNFLKTQEIEEQTEAYKELCRQMKKSKKTMSSGQVLELREKIEESYRKLVQLRSETNTFYPEDVDRKEIFDKGNRRKEDLFNRAKVSGGLVSLDLPDFDQFTSRAEKDISPEHLVLDYMTKKPVKKVVRRRKKKV